MIDAFWFHIIFHLSISILFTLMFDTNIESPSNRRQLINKFGDKKHHPHARSASSEFSLVCRSYSTIFVYILHFSLLYWLSKHRYACNGMWLQRYECHFRFFFSHAHSQSVFAVHSLHFARHARQCSSVQLRMANMQSRAEHARRQQQLIERGETYTQIQIHNRSKFGRPFFVLRVLFLFLETILSPQKIAHQLRVNEDEWRKFYASKRKSEWIWMSFSTSREKHEIQWRRHHFVFLAIIRRRCRISACSISHWKWKFSILEKQRKKIMYTFPFNFLFFFIHLLVFSEFSPACISIPPQNHAQIECWNCSNFIIISLLSLFLSLFCFVNI